jgi:hypothetical protein
MTSINPPSKGIKCKLCGKAASFGMPDGNREFCSSHKRPGNIYLKHNRGESEISASALLHVPKGLDYSHPEERERSSIHVENVDNRQMCHVSGCLKAPSYGISSSIGPIPAVSCSTHRRPGEVYLKDIRSTSNRTILNKADSHLPRGLVHVPNTASESDRIKHHDENTEGELNKILCHHMGCTKAASYNFEDCEQPLYCFTHKSPTMRIVHQLHQAPGMGKKKIIPLHNDDHKSSEPHHDQDPNALLIPRDTAISVNVNECIKFIKLSHSNREDPTFAVKYLANIVEHFDDNKFRTIKMSNPKFMNKVWLNPGLRGLFQSIGFREYNRGVLELISNSKETQEAITFSLKELCDQSKMSTPDILTLR